MNATHFETKHTIHNHPDRATQRLPYEKFNPRLKTKVFIASLPGPLNPRVLRVALAAPTVRLSNHLFVKHCGETNKNDKKNESKKNVNMLIQVCIVIQLHPRHIKRTCTGYFTGLCLEVYLYGKIISDRKWSSEQSNKCQFGVISGLILFCAVF